MFGIDPSFFTSLLQVIMIDLVLAGDNAVVIGLAAAGLAADVRKKAILIGIIAATVLRICFALITTQLLSLGGGAADRRRRAAALCVLEDVSRTHRLP
jgi:predicted tellurium resistance membrane protein TerC